MRCSAYRLLLNHIQVVIVHSGDLRVRLFFVVFIFLFLLFFLFAHLAAIQIVGFPFYSSVAKDQHTVSVPLEARRGTIFDREMRALAVNLTVESVYANPREVVDRRGTARALASVLGLKEKYLIKRLGEDRGFVWIKRKVTTRQADLIRRMKLKGVSLIKESKRFYPNGPLACHLLGVVDIDNTGLEGLELVHDRYLKGTNGWMVSTQDGKRRMLKLYHHDSVPARDGFNLVLTIDEVIQNIAERELEAMYMKYHAAGASIIVMDPATGDILAMASFPNFDMNAAASRSRESLRNRAISDFFEPGSVFKIVTASAALETRAVSLDDRFFCENGEYHLGRRVLHDHRPHGVLTFKEVIELSSNIGTVKAASRFGERVMYDFISRFGFRSLTGIDLPGEVLGMNRELKKWSKVSMLAIPMGQEVTTTTIQLARAISVIANGGFLVRPRVADRILDGSGEQVKGFPAEAPKRVISAETASRMREVLAGAVENGTGKKARVDGYRAGGKTGTAQKVEPGGRFSHEKFVASFIGFAPVESPRLAIAVCVDEPRVVYFGGDVAAPVFSKVAEASLKYLNAKEPSYALSGRQ